MNKLKIILPLVVLSFAGCTSMTGLDASTEFKCAAPVGVSCMSMSGVLANINAGNLGTLKDGESILDEPGSNSSNDSPKIKVQEVANSIALPPLASPAQMAPLEAGEPIYIPPRRLRIWLAPFTDQKGRLHEQRLVYSVVEDGRWAVDSLTSNIQNAIPNKVFKLKESADQELSNDPKKVDNQREAQ